MKMPDNQVYDGRGFRKYFWYMVFEVAVVWCFLRGENVEIGKNSTVKNFRMQEWEVETFYFARFVADHCV